MTPVQCNVCYSRTPMIEILPKFWHCPVCDAERDIAFEQQQEEARRKQEATGYDKDGFAIGLPQDHPARAFIAYDRAKFGGTPRIEVALDYTDEFKVVFGRVPGVYALTMRTRKHSQKDSASLYYEFELNFIWAPLWDLSHAVSELRKTGKRYAYAQSISEYQLNTMNTPFTRWRLYYFTQLATNIWNTLDKEASIPFGGLRYSVPVVPRPDSNYNLGAAVLAYRKYQSDPIMNNPGRGYLHGGYPIWQSQLSATLAKYYGVSESDILESTAAYRRYKAGVIDLNPDAGAMSAMNLERYLEATRK